MLRDGSFKNILFLQSYNGTKRVFGMKMKLKIKLYLMCLIILFLTLMSMMSISNQEKEEKEFNQLTISVLLSSSDFNEIFHETISFSSEQNMRIKTNEGIEVYPKNETYTLNKDSLEIGESLHVEAVNNDSITIETINRSYGYGNYNGTLDIYCTKNGFIIVNTLPLETYLRFVVPSEMPSDYGLEALKAQAVCARNFAIQHIVNPAYPEYNACLDDSIRYQVYNNQVANENADRAIKETENMVLKYNDELISTYYYSTSWGHTTDLSLWNGGDCPYYKALSLSEKHEYMELTDEEAFKEALINYNDAYESAEPWYRWTYFISLEDIEKNVDEYLDIEIDGIDNIEIVSRRAGGSVSSLKLISGENTYNLTKESEVRNIFIPVNSSIERNDGSVLDGYTKCPSSYYLLEPSYENDVLIGYVLSGGGCGHGLGMSQNCAKILDSEGKDFKEILKYFYIGTDVMEYH